MRLDAKGNGSAELARALAGGGVVRQGSRVAGKAARRQAEHSAGRQAGRQQAGSAPVATADSSTLLPHSRARVTTLRVTSMPACREDA